MLTDMEPSIQTASVIARLMGLDDLPSQPPQPSIHKRRRVLSENYLRKTASIGLCEKSVLYSGRSYRVATNQRSSKNGVEEGTPMMDRNSSLSVLEKKVNSNAISTNMCSTKASGVAKHPLTNEKLHHSKQFDDIMEHLHFNQGKQSRCLQQPDLPPKKQLQGQQSLEPHFSGYSGELYSFSAHRNRESEFCNNSNKARTARSILRLRQKLENDSLSGPVGNIEINNLHKLLICQSDLKEKKHLSFTRIIVHKPTSRNAMDSVSTSFTGAYGANLSGDGKKADLLRAEKGEERCETTKKERTDEMESSRQDNGDLKNINKRIADVSRLFRPPCRSINNWDKVGQAPCSANGSGLAMVANKQIFERWKTTKIFEEGNGAGKRCTLREMLDVSDRETSQLCNKLDKGGSFSLLNQQRGLLVSVNRFGITSKIEGKVEKRISPQSKLHRLKFRGRNEASLSGQLLRQEHVIGVELSKTKNQKHNLEPRESIITPEKPQFPPNLNLENQNIQEDGAIYKSSSSCNRCIDTNNGQLSRVSQVIKDKKESSFSKDDVSGDTDYSSDVLHSSIGSHAASCVAEAVSIDGQSSDFDISSSEFKELQLEPMLISLVKDDDAVQVWETSSRQKLSNDFDVEGFGFSNSTISSQILRNNLRENNQQSPNSVLDPPFPEENVHTFQGFAAADLYSVARRLRLKKSVSEETYSEGTEMDVSSDDNTEKGSVDFSPDAGKMLEEFHVEESRNFSYMVDVLDEAGFTGVNMEIGFRTLNSLEYPMSHSVFEALEKKYGKQTSWQRSERRLLFDRINAGLEDILDFDINFWAKPLRKRFSAALRRDEIEEELWTLLISEDKQAEKDLSEKACGTETKWLQLSEDIHDICRDVVNDLFKELIGELAGIEDL